MRRGVLVFDDLSGSLPIHFDLQEVIHSRDTGHLFGFRFNSCLFLRAFDWASQRDRPTRSHNLHIVGIRRQRTISNHSLADIRRDLPISFVFRLISRRLSCPIAVTAVPGRVICVCGRFLSYVPLFSFGGTSRPPVSKKADNTNNTRFLFI